jgi:hypothetical protein
LIWASSSRLEVFQAQTFHLPVWHQSSAGTGGRFVMAISLSFAYPRKIKPYVKSKREKFIIKNLRKYYRFITVQGL